MVPLRPFPALLCRPLQILALLLPMRRICSGGALREKVRSRAPLHLQLPARVCSAPAAPPGAPYGRVSLNMHCCVWEQQQQQQQQPPESMDS